MTTRADLRTELANRLGDPTNTVWSTTDLNGYIAFATSGLYPTVYSRNVSTSAGGDGPTQTLPGGVRNIYMVGLQVVGATRVRAMRGWAEGIGTAYIPKLSLAGDTLVWAWTDGFTCPADDTTALTVPNEGLELLVLKAQVSALEKLLSNRVARQKYMALNVREVITEDEIATTLDALHHSIKERVDHAVPLPPVVK